MYDLSIEEVIEIFETWTLYGSEEGIDKYVEVVKKHLAEENGIDD